MNKGIKFGVVAATFVALVMACSTEKNTAVNRAYHYTTARFNGHFNANELLMTSLATYRENVEENYYSILPIEAVPNEQEVEALLTPIDTAISKVKTVITDHSMPGNDKPSKKNAEHNNYIDENWLTLGKAYYYRRDYETAMKSFKFVNKYFSNDPSNYIGELWVAKTNIRIGNLTDAKLGLDRLDQALENEKADSEYKQKQTKEKKSKASKLNSGGQSSKTEEPAKFPKKIKFDVQRTKADLALAQKNYPKTIEFLESALKEAKKSADKGRVNYILGQLYEHEGNGTTAATKFRAARKYKIPYQMSFSAQLKATTLENGPKAKKELNKMLRDAKNAEFKDQIYYALAIMDINEGNDDQAMKDLTLSAFYSSRNVRQKGMAYQKMGDLRYAKRDYIKAQKYYDSCVTVVSDDFPNIKDIRYKAERLSDLVEAVETAHYEDSIQRIARMQPEEQEAYLKDVLKKQDEEAKAKAQREAEKLRELAKNNNAFSQDMGNKGGGYWSNGKQVQDGAVEFVKIWGQRNNEDHWRRSDKVLTQTTPGIGADSSLVAGGTVNNQTNDTNDPRARIDALKKNLPVSDEEFTRSNERLVKALYDAGILYKELLKEMDIAKQQFHAVLDKKFESEYNPMSAYQLYKMYQNSDDGQAATQRNYILENYPKSDYASYMRDPDFFIKRKEREKLAEQEYVSVFNLYNRKVYYPVIAKAERVLEQEPENQHRSKYMLLLAMAKGQTTDDKQELLPILNQILEEYPSTEEAKRAQAMIDIIKNGYSKNEPVVFGNKTIYSYNEKAPQVVLIFLEDKDNVDVSKLRVNDFTREFFPQSKQKVSSNLFKGNQNVIMVSEFAKEKDAREYVSKYKATKKHLLNLHAAKIVIISPANLKILFETGELDQYESFFLEYY